MSYDRTLVVASLIAAAQEVGDDIRRCHGDNTAEDHDVEPAAGSRLVRGALSVKPRLLDLFCGAGGAAMGYYRAGFEVVGVDIAPQPNYPFAFEQIDFREAFVDYDNVGMLVREFDAVHASPPCQAFTAYQRTGNVGEYPDLIAPVRELLRATGLPYVIENVHGAPLLESVVLCGSQFDLDVQRHRLFETNWPLVAPWQPCRHKIWSRRFKSSTGRKPDSRFSIEIGSWDEPLARQKAAMGVDWKITLEELSEAIPPAYTEFIGTQLLAHLDVSTDPQAHLQGLGHA